MSNFREHWSKSRLGGGRSVPGLVLVLVLVGDPSSKSLQSCLTLCNPIDGSPLGSSVPGILQAEYWSGLPLILGKHENSGLGETQEAAQLAMLEPAGRKQELGCRKEAGNRD